MSPVSRVTPEPLPFRADSQTTEGDRFQDQNQKKLTMTAPVKKYFKETFGLDTTKEGLRAMMARIGH